MSDRRYFAKIDVGYLYEVLAVDPERVGEADETPQVGPFRGGDVESDVQAGVGHVSGCPSLWGGWCWRRGTR